MNAHVDRTRPGKTVYLHVGAPTTGGAYLQRVLWDNRRRLGEDGVCYPVAGPLEHFGAVMDLRDLTWGGHRDPAWAGTWDRIAQRARDFDGHTVVLSQEQLGGANEEQVRRAVESFGDAEVHVVFTTRDLGWQLIFDWQEQVRHGHTITFERFVQDLVTLGIHAPEPFGEMFWGLHDPVRVLGMWEKAVPRERVHVLTLPPPGAGPGPLWARFCELTGIDPHRYELGGLEQEPLTVVEAELLRRMNGRLTDALGGEYERMVRDHLIGGGLAEAADGTRRTPMGLPAKHAEWAAGRTRELVATLRERGYRVQGDLEELTTARIPEAVLLPGEVPEDEVVTAMVAVVCNLLVRLAEVDDRIGLAHLQAQMAGVRENLELLLKTAANPSPGLQRAARRATGRKP
ncbi:hypothetical protein ACQEU3_20880 [Spirillospora sp. CA-253888]